MDLPTGGEAEFCNRCLLSARDLLVLIGSAFSGVWQLGTMPILKPVVEGEGGSPRVEIVNCGAGTQAMFRIFLNDIFGAADLPGQSASTDLGWLRVAGCSMRPRNSVPLIKMWG